MPSQALPKASLRLPFSSPMTINPEDFSSATTPTATHIRFGKLTLPREGSYEPSEQPSREKSQEPATTEAREWTQKGSGRHKPTGLNVVTTFSPPQQRPDEIYRPNIKSKHLSTRRPKALNPQKQAVSPKRARNGAKGPVGSLRRADSKASGLSPSDRDLVIGIAIPHGPDIIVTPAVVNAPWSLPNQHRPRRATSSIYSSYPHLDLAEHKRSFPHIESSTIVRPPLPEIPQENFLPNSKYHSPGSAISTWTTWTTDDEEDETVHDAISRRSSFASQRRILRRASTDTIATKHRSKGWWNQILSPFLEKSSMSIGKSSPSSSTGTTPTNETTKADTEPSTLPKNLSPETPGVRDVGLQTDGRPISRFFIDPSPVNDLSGIGFHQGQTVLSPETTQEPRRGEAAEYFEASWHDLNHTEPYFACHYHTCPKGWATGWNPDLASNYQARALPNQEKSHFSPDESFADMSAEMDGSGRGVEQNVVKDALRSQTPQNRFSAAFERATRPNTDGPLKVVSQGTENDAAIDDDMVGTPHETPVVHEAHAAPILSAPLPVPIPRSVGLKPAEFNKASTTNKLLPTPSLPTPDSVGHDTGFISAERESPPHLPLASALTRSDSPLPEKRRDLKSEPAFLKPEAFNSARAPPLPPTATSISDRKETTQINSIPAQHRSQPRSLGQGTVEQVRGTPDLPPQPVYVTNNYYGFPEARHQNAGYGNVFPPPPGSVHDREAGEQIDEKGGSSKSNKKLAACLSRRNGKKEKAKKNKLCCCFFFLLLCMVAIILGLIMGLTLKHADIPLQTAWLNLTGFPPIPTGIATIARPDAVFEQSGCVQPQTMWSCAVPKEEQDDIKPNDPDQPNFRIQIRYDNSSTESTNSSKAKRSVQPVNAVSAGALMRRQELKARDYFINGFFNPNPAPPSKEDQVFLGQTTDNITIPYDGEWTPFYMSFLPTVSSDSNGKLRKRQSEGANSDPFVNFTDTIPPPSANPDGTAQAANLIPFAAAQPLRLYNRGKPTEHYGFFTYYDRSIFLQSVLLFNTTNNTPISADENGGAPEGTATVRCTWRQTRFLVQIWTKMGSSISILPPTTNDTSASSPTGTSTASSPSSTSNSATDFSRPGSFPYPVTITLDRHGGDPSQKMIYCYAMDDHQRLINEEKKVQLEDRSFGGVLANPAMGAFGNVTGPIDGGSGGCGCQWRNWEES